MNVKEIIQYIKNNIDEGKYFREIQEIIDEINEKIEKLEEESEE